MGFGETRNEQQVLADLGRIADALERLAALAVRYMNDDTTLLDRLVVGEETNRRLLEATIQRVDLIASAVHGSAVETFLEDMEEQK